jgi:hypothetical protein
MDEKDRLAEEMAKASEQFKRKNEEQQEDWKKDNRPIKVSKTIKPERTKCPKCETSNKENALFCSQCGNKLQDARAYSKREPENSRWRSLILLVILVVIAVGFLRVYYGGGIGMRIVAKHSFSFKDTIVNLDNVLGQPRIIVAAKHPAVKRQLEEMGIIETDEQIQKRVREEIEVESKRIMREAEAESKRMMREIEKETKRLQRELGY